MSFNHIKLKDLLALSRLRLSEAEGDEAEKEEAGGNPFTAAGGEEGGEEEGGEEAAPEEEPAADAEGGEDKEDGAKKAAQPSNFPIKFNKRKVKEYNNANFISNEGELKSITKKGLVVTVKPDEVDIFVNFSDIL